MQKEKRVVVTGIGVVAPNGVGVDAFLEALRSVKSGIRFFEESKRLNLRCQIGGQPILEDNYLDSFGLADFYLKKIGNKAIHYAILAGLEAWRMAGLPELESPNPDWGLIFGAGDLGFDSLTKEYPSYVIDRGENRKLGALTVTECMNSGAAAYLNTLIGFGNRVISNSSACITGSEAILMGFERIQQGKASILLCGSTEGDGRYIWAAFDALRVLCSDSNEHPEKGSRPMHPTSSGFVPSGGSGALVLESLESALTRGATIYGEILGGEVNSGGQKNGGSMTAPSSEGVVRCISQALLNAKISAEDIQLISGHLTSTKADSIEIVNWKRGLNLKEKNFPYINTPKSMIGHCIAGAGSIETVACVLQLYHGFIHGQLNLDDIHPNILNEIDQNNVPTKTLDIAPKVIAKANFGFGDLNAVLILKKWEGI